MVEHIVLFKLKSDAPPEAVQAMVDGLSGLRTSIPGIVDLTVGENFGDRSQGFTHGLTVRFQSRQALDDYIPHPAHQKAVQELIRPILDEIIVVDYEI